MPRTERRRSDALASDHGTAEDSLPPPTDTLPPAAYSAYSMYASAFQTDPQQVSSQEIRASVSAFFRNVGRSTEEDETIERLLSVLRTRLRDRRPSIAPGQEEKVAEQMLAAVPRRRSTRAAEVIGPCYDTGGLTSWLGITKQAVDKRRRRHQLLGLQQNGLWAYPAWQFAPNTKVTIPGLQAVLEQLAAGTDDSWAWALWMSTRLPGQLEGKPVWEWLRDGGPVDDVLVLAGQDAASWAAA